MMCENVKHQRKDGRSALATASFTIILRRNTIRVVVMAEKNHFISIYNISICFTSHHHDSMWLQNYSMLRNLDVVYK